MERLPLFEQMSPKGAEVSFSCFDELMDASGCEPGGIHYWPHEQLLILHTLPPSLISHSLAIADASSRKAKALFEQEGQKPSKYLCLQASLGACWDEASFWHREESFARQILLDLAGVGGRGVVPCPGPLMSGGMAPLPLSPHSPLICHQP